MWNDGFPESIVIACNLIREFHKNLFKGDKTKTWRVRNENAKQILYCHVFFYLIYRVRLQTFLGEASRFTENLKIR
jgi:hypothetical protein